MPKASKMLLYWSQKNDKLTKLCRYNESLKKKHNSSFSISLQPPIVKEQKIFPKKKKDENWQSRYVWVLLQILKAEEIMRS